MRLAVSTDGANVSGHFGRCPEYTLVDIEDGEIKNKKVIPNPGHEPGFLPKFLSDNKVHCIITGGMGPRAQTLFSQFGIKTIVGASGPVDKIIEDFINDELSIGESQCDHDSPSHTKCDEESLN